jgi:hypothetical protein
VTALSTTSTASTMSSSTSTAVASVGLPVRPALGTTTHVNVPLPATIKTRPKVI